MQIRIGLRVYKVTGEGSQGTEWQCSLPHQLLGLLIALIIKIGMGMIFSQVTVSNTPVMLSHVKVQYKCQCNNGYPSFLLMPRPA